MEARADLRAGEGVKGAGQRRAFARDEEGPAEAEAAAFGQHPCEVGVYDNADDHAAGDVLVWIAGGDPQIAGEGDGVGEVGAEGGLGPSEERANGVGLDAGKASVRTWMRRICFARRGLAMGACGEPPAQGCVAAPSCHGGVVEESLDRVEHGGFMVLAKGAGLGAARGGDSPILA